MPMKTEGIEEPTLNLTPMIDIVFLLIIFFMVGTQFVDAERRFEIELPAVSDASALTSLPDPATVAVTADGKTHLDGEPVDPAALERRLAAMRANYPGQAVLVRGDAAVAYQRIVDVLAACRRAGIGSVSLANRTVPEE